MKKIELSDDFFPEGTVSEESRGKASVKTDAHAVSVILGKPKKPRSRRTRATKKPELAPQSNGFVLVFALPFEMARGMFMVASQLFRSILPPARR